MTQMTFFVDSKVCSPLLYLCTPAFYVSIETSAIMNG